jgi:hypothetical protein
LEDLLAPLDLFVAAFAFRDEHVESGGALQRGAMGDVEKTAAILGSVLAIALGDVQRDRGRCAIQLILDVTDTHGLFDQPGDPGNECDGFAIDFEPFVIEPAVVGGGHGNSFLRRCRRGRVRVG